MTRDKLFIILTGAPLFFLFLFLVGMMISVFLYTKLDPLIMALLSDEILFAIQLSVTTATLATITCLAVTIPASYALSRLNFPGKNFIDAILNIPIVMPPIALGASLLIFLSTPSGQWLKT